MTKFIIKGGKKLEGRTQVSGAKNVALKALVAACLTEEEVVIENIPLISDFSDMTEIIEDLGGEVKFYDHKISVKMKSFKKTKVSLDKAAAIRTSAMFLAPLLGRSDEAIIPNPGGCRIGARPIDRIIDGLSKMGVKVRYHSDDGYFYMTRNKRLEGVTYRFKKNTHTGTETLILCAVLANGTTRLENAAEEPEIDELINFLKAMGAKITKPSPRTVEIEGVARLKGATFKIGPDRNEIVTLAVAAIITQGDIFIEDVENVDLLGFEEKLLEAGGGFERRKDGIRFYNKGSLKAVDITTSIYPGFMTDWQGPWAVLMTSANGKSVIHETIYESRFGYAKELKKMGARINLFNPKVEAPEAFYNFNMEDDRPEFKHAAEIHGPVRLHNAVVSITDLRAGATLVLAALAAKGERVLFEVEHLDRGYESIEKRLRQLGADIERVDE